MSSPSSSTVEDEESCDECLKFLDLPAAYGEFARHLRVVHNSEHRYKHLDFAHCLCGRLFPSGKSLNRHMTKCLCKHRAIKHDRCSCLGCTGRVGQQEATPCTPACAPKQTPQQDQMRRILRAHKMNINTASSRASISASNNGTRALDNEMTRDEQKSRTEIIGDLLLERMVDHVQVNGMPSCFMPGTESNKEQGKRKRRGTVAVERSQRRLLKRYCMKAKKDNKAKSELEKKGYTPLQLASTKRARDLAARLRAAEHPSVSNFPRQEIPAPPFVPRVHDPDRSAKEQFQKKFQALHATNAKKLKNLRVTCGKLASGVQSLRKEVVTFQSSFQRELKALQERVSDSEGQQRLKAPTPSQKRRTFTTVGAIVDLVKQIQDAVRADKMNTSEPQFYSFVRKKLGLYEGTADKIASAFLLLMLYKRDAIRDSDTKIEDVKIQIAKALDADLALCEEKSCKPLLLHLLKRAATPSPEFDELVKMFLLTVY